MIKIAIADDHPQIREIWNFILSANADFEVVTICTNGQEAIDAAVRYSPDIFLMDINMQPVNGIEATATITKLYPGVKIIGMSIHMDELYVKSMLEAGARGYITKNSPYEEVVECIVQVNAGKHYICDEVQKQLPGLLIV